MRQFTAMLVAVVISSGLVLAGDVKTITGEGKCGKCALGETKTCQNVIEVTENGKVTKYYLAKNAVADAYHGTVCKATVKTTVTGEVEEKDGKQVITATKVEKAK
jgi:hypothetical protein